MSSGRAASQSDQHSPLSTVASVIERDWPVDPRQLQALVADLRHNDERTQFALAAARTGVWEAELFTGQVEWSETMHLAMGRRAADFDGTIDGMRLLIYEDDRDQFARVVHGNFDHPRDFRCDVRVPWPDDTMHHVQLRGQIVPDADGMAVRLVSVAQDITEQKQLELKLRQAQKMEAMGRLAGGVAHDFNNILTAILGYAMLIETDPADRNGAERHALQIKKAAERAATLTRQLLAFSRRQVVEKRAVYIADAMAELVPMLAKLLGEQIHMELDIAADTHPVFADPGQIQQVVMNLAINARESMPNGGRLTIKAGNTTLTSDACMPRFKMAAGEYVVLSVTDTGSGMDQSSTAQMFEPSFTKDATPDAGLGLPTVFDIVKGLGGAIRVSSELDRGTTFTIYIPNSDSSTRAVVSRGASGVIGGSETVLVVEDEDGVRAFVADMLTRNGYTVLTAASAVHARAVLTEASRTPDLVLTDVMMPNGTGPELVESISSQVGKRVRALYMSGYAGAALAQQGKMAADSEFLQKPFTGPQLLLKVRQLLDASSHAATAAHSPVLS